MKINHKKINDLPLLVKTLCFCHDAWIVGSGALYICGNTDVLPRDWDVIVPLNKWSDACKLIPYQTPSNTYGGFKVDNAIDVWCDDLGSFFAKVHKKHEDLPLLAVQPKYMLKAELH